MPSTQGNDILLCQSNRRVRYSNPGLDHPSIPLGYLFEFVLMVMLKSHHCDYP